MTPLLIKVPLALNQSFSVRTDLGICYENEWHHHEEIEILYVTRGGAKSRIGDSMHEIKSGDLILLGSKLPHMLTKEEYGRARTDFQATVIHFSPEILNSFINLPENESLFDLLKRPSLSLDIKGQAQTAITDLIKPLRFATNTQRLIYLLQILQSIIQFPDDCTPISSASFRYTANRFEEHRLNKVYSYTKRNYQREINLKEISELIHMTPNSFCRYFKSRTNKTYSQLLTEVRINHACRLLKDTELSVSEISLQSGYLNFSNFSMHFKELTGKTPLQYRKAYNVYNLSPQDEPLAAGRYPVS